MRIAIEGDPGPSAAPGRPAHLRVVVTNTSKIIDAYTARIVGVDPKWVTSQPRQISLFPDAEGTLDLTITVPPQFPAGPYPCILEVAAQVDITDRAQLEFPLIVEGITDAKLAVTPPIGRGKRHAQFSVDCTNDGNTPLDFTFGATDAQRALRYTFEPPTVAVAPGATATAKLDVRMRPRVVGAEIERAIAVTATAEDLEIPASATLRHKPLVPSGLATAAILAAIIALWAGAFVIGVRAVTKDDPKTKAVPVSFYAPLGAGQEAAPADAAPKSGGTAPPAIAASLHGTVSAKSTQKGVAGITVQAYRVGNTVAAPASAATDATGTYTMTGLFPGHYKLRFRAHGYTDVWYPQATSRRAAQDLNLAVSQDFEANAQLSGHPASITGQVDTGPSSPKPTVAVLLVAANSKDPATGPHTLTDANGNYTFKNVPAPQTYRLSFVTFGYQVVNAIEKVNAGEAHLANTVKLVAGTGQISGIVTDGTNPLGGVTISTVNKGKPVTATTPTVGAVGTFVITGLDSPATYLLTFAKQGYGTQVQPVDLAAGADAGPVIVALVGGQGTISGTVLGTGNAALGNATVTANAGTTEVTTTTVTARGTYQLSGLPTPGTYAVTFTAGGYQSQTIPVTLTTNGFKSGVNVTLKTSLGTFQGVVKSGSTPLPSVAIALTDGVSVINTTSVSAPTPGGFAFPDLPAGTYSVTFHLDGFADTTILLHLDPNNGSNNKSVTVTMKAA